MRGFLQTLYQGTLQYLGGLTVLAAGFSAFYVAFLGWSYIPSAWQYLGLFCVLAIFGAVVFATSSMPASISNPHSSRHIVPAQLWVGLAAFVPASVIYGLAMALGGHDVARELALSLIAITIVVPYVAANLLALALCMWAEEGRARLSFK